MAALAWGIFWFTLPYLLLPTHAGWLADRFCKRTVIVWCKAAEIVLMWLGMGAILTGSAACLFAVLFLMGVQAALFAPATWTAAALVFVTFRVFDVLKPYPAGAIDRHGRGGYGVVGDDLVAGAYAGILTRVILEVL